MAESPHPTTSPLEDDWDEVSEGLPQESDQFIQKYLHGRQALISQEKKQRSDHAFRQALSPTAREACEIVRQIRERERRTIWTREFEDSFGAADNDGDVYPGMMFSRAKERMEQTELWKIVRKMPKGALLHAHFDAMIDVDWLLDTAMATDGMHILSREGSLHSDTARNRQSFSFVYAPSTPASDTTLWDVGYRASVPVPIGRAADTFPDGGREGFFRWVTDRCTITAEESVRHHHGLDAIWQKFTSTFAILGSIIFYEPILRAGIQRMCRGLLDDGVRWVDLRAAFIFQYRREGCEKPEDGYLEVIRVLAEEIEKFKATAEGQDFWGARMIWTSLRRFGRREIVESMKQCIEVKKAYPDMIAGFDLVGQEDLGRPLRDLTPELFWFRKRCVEESLEIPFFFHCGECLGDGDETDENLFDALLLGTRRIGHGFSLYKHPLLIDMVKEKRILVESCPISNEVLRLTSSIQSHPLPALLSRGVSVALCNDDPAILGQGRNGMSHDFLQALQGWENLGLAGLGALAENSVRWAAFEDENTKAWVTGIKQATLGSGIRAHRMREWAIEWERFCFWVVSEYAQETEDDRDVTDEGESESEGEGEGGGGGEDRDEDEHEDERRETK